MSKLLRIIDVNVNRAGEGIRVLEEYIRFITDDPVWMSELRSMRHDIRKSMPENAQDHRDAQGDVGRDVSSSNTLDDKTSVKQVLTANFVRVQEALRVLEEYYKVIDHYETAKRMERYRYRMYELESTISIKRQIKGLYAITSQGSRDEILCQVQMFIDSGVGIIQYRDKCNSESVKLEIALRIRELTMEHGVIFIVNDSPTLAMASRADGVHVGQEDESLCKVRRLCKDMIIGISTHNEVQFEEALNHSPDYIALGPIYGTTSKKDVEPCSGESYARWARKRTELALVAIGGIGIEELVRLKKIGIDACAMISALENEATIRKLVEAYTN
ncbi:MULTISPECIES: thiamine phosphate synthase [unclassified Fusibacter]|uniref:thiamine phosphate synthase n=1 Tax=unclassified Fusibacter TaxID=2624464 RepID=UPI001010FA26|nr:MULTISPECIES: thiamine phosphate synthase [unclassified Fusibacter]MCK8059930.1 thiamine phosphate synthase [Fusibacter sp. A2]NPE22072.1 thiamine phosphate synthase [Fusibacter sp. A1]RXV60851.1 thiamine phosphate synthase [Fusibacter sp. A1]